VIRLWERLALASAVFWLAAGIAIFAFRLQNAVWPVLVYSIYANIGTDLSRWQAAREGRHNRQDDS
jgi:hypothetical protein